MRNLKKLCSKAWIISKEIDILFRDTLENINQVLLCRAYGILSKKYFIKLSQDFVIKLELMTKLCYLVNCFFIWVSTHQHVWSFFVDKLDVMYVNEKYIKCIINKNVFTNLASNQKK